MKSLIAIIILSILFYGCVTSTKMNKLSLGMSKDEAIQTIGKPISTSAQGGMEFLRYNLSSDGLTDDEYYVRIIDGKVESYGRTGDFDSTKIPESKLELNITK